MVWGRVSGASQGHCYRPESISAAHLRHACYYLPDGVAGSVNQNADDNIAKAMCIDKRIDMRIDTKQAVQEHISK